MAEVKDLVLWRPNFEAFEGDRSMSWFCLVALEFIEEGKVISEREPVLTS